MGRHPSTPGLWILPAALAVGLGGCQPAMYQAQPLQTISAPPAALLARLPAPDCVIWARAPATKSKAKSSAEPKPNDAAKAPGKKDGATTPTPKTSTKSAAAADRKAEKPGDYREALRKERDCYQRAEQRARARLERLQASTTAALDDAERRQQADGPAYRGQDHGAEPGRQGSYLSFEQRRARGS